MGKIKFKKDETFNPGKMISCMFGKKNCTIGKHCVGIYSGKKDKSA